MAFISCMQMLFLNEHRNQKHLDSLGNWLIASPQCVICTCSLVSSNSMCKAGRLLPASSDILCCPSLALAESCYPMKLLALSIPAKQVSGSTSRNHAYRSHASIWLALKSFMLIYCTFFHKDSISIGTCKKQC